MTTYTIDVQPACIIVHEEHLKHARLQYRAPGLEIYVIGAVPLKKRDLVHYHAYEICRSMHIPVLQLVKDGWV